MAPAHSLEPGAVLGRYRIHSLLGRGGAGAVYRAAALEDGRQVAIKVHAPQSGRDENWRWRLRREFFLMAQLAHPHIVPVLDWDEHDDLIYYAMELVDGRDAASLSPMPPPSVVELLRAIASALALVHNHGLLHRDVKPHNILVPSAPDGTPDVTRALLTDFGLLVRHDEASLDRGGTPAFMAPESRLGASLDVRSDLYGLGATAFALLTDKPPPLRFTDEVPLRLPPAVPDHLAVLVAELLAVDPRLRPGSAAELLGRLAPREQTEPIEPVRLQRLLRSPPLVERSDALEGLRRVWAEASGGRAGAPAFVVSAPGLGRTRLLHQFALELRAGGARVGQAAARRGHPIDLIAELLRPLAADPQLGPPPALPGRSGARPLAAARQVVDHLVGGARPRPTALCIDDLDIGDESSLEVVEELSRASQGRPLLILCAVALEPARAFASRARLRRFALDIISLDRLTPTGVQQVLEGIFGPGAATAALVGELDRISGGSPRRLMAALEALVGDGRVVQAAGRWRLPRQIDLADRWAEPTGLHGARRAELGADARHLAELLALSAEPLELRDLAAASQQSRQQFLVALEGLRERQMVRTGPTGAVAIADPSIEAALRQDLPIETMRRGHAALATALRARLPRPIGSHERALLEIQIGRHISASGGDLDGATWLIRGARRLVTQGAFSAAIDPLRQAIAIFEERGGADRHPELLDLWEQLGVASLMRDGRLSFTCFERIVAHLDRSGELSAIARAARTFGPRIGVLTGIAGAAGRRLARGRWRAALRLHTEADRYVRGLAYLSVVEAQGALLDRARHHIDQLEAFARARGRDAEAVAIVARAHWSFSMGRFEEVRALKKAGLAVLDEKPGALAPEHASRARSSLHLMGAWVDALTAGSASLDLGLRAASIDEMFEMHALMVPAAYHAVRGEIRDLLAARAALYARCFRLRSGWQEAFIHAPTAPALMDAGLVAQLRDDVALLAELDIPPSPWRDIIRHTVPALMLMAEGNHERAIQLCLEAHAVARRAASGSIMYLVHAQQYAAEALLGSGRPAEAEAHLRDVIAMADSAISRDRPSSLRARRGLIRAALARRDLDTAAALLAETSKQLENIDLPGERAALLLLAGEHLLASGASTMAAKRAEAAQRQFTELGNPLGAERALGLRRRSGDQSPSVDSPIDDDPTDQDATMGATVTISVPGTGADTDVDQVKTGSR